MDNTFSRTSITLDEAVMILLDLAKGPIAITPLHEPVTDEEQEILDGERFSLQEWLEDEKDRLEGAYLEAKADKMPAHVIKARRALLEEHEAVIDLAKTHLSSINDELNKGESSKLHFDTTLSNSLHTYITLSSLDEWAYENYKRRFLAPVPEGLPSAADTTTTKKALPKVRRRQSDQVDAIVAEIVRQNHDPLAMPPFKPGKDGVKVAVWRVLEGDDLFRGRDGASLGIFNKAWERALKSGKIAYVT